MHLIGVLQSDEAIAWSFRPCIVFKELEGIDDGTPLGAWFVRLLLAAPLSVHFASHVKFQDRWLCVVVTKKVATLPFSEVHVV